MSAFEIISKEISDMTFSIVFNMLIFIAFAWFISKFAKSTIPRLLWIAIGLYLIIDSAQVSDKILYDIDTLFGVGFILPHISFFFRWLEETFETLKLITIDSYVFVITIYYKIRNFFLWFCDTYKKIYNFFTKKQDSRQEQQQDYYQEQQYREYKSYKKDSHKFYDETRDKKQEYQEKSSYKEQKIYEEAKVKQELSLEEQLMQDERYKHFFSESAYTIIGVSINDDFKTMKKRYRTLAQEYHPDKNREETEKYTILFKRINGAYQTLEKFHNK